MVVWKGVVMMLILKVRILRFREGKFIIIELAEWELKPWYSWLQSPHLDFMGTPTLKKEIFMIRNSLRIFYFLTPKICSGTNGLLIRFYDSYTKTALSEGKCPMGGNNNHVTLTKTFIFIASSHCCGKKGVRNEVDAVRELGIHLMTEGVFGGFKLGDWHDQICFRKITYK